MWVRTRNNFHGNREYGNNHWWMCSSTKRNIHVVRLIVRTCGGGLALVISTFHFPHHIRSQCTDCRTPVSLCRSSFRLFAVGEICPTVVLFCFINFAVREFWRVRFAVVNFLFRPFIQRQNFVQVVFRRSGLQTVKSNDVTSLSNQLN